MELCDISKVLYEMMRLKEDRLLMTWEDERGNFLAEINKLRTSTEAANEKISEQQSDYERLIRTISGFSSTSSPPQLRVTESKRKSTSKAKVSAVTSTVTCDTSNDEFISIDRGGKLHKGPLHSYFMTPGSTSHKEKEKEKEKEKGKGKEKNKENKTQMKHVTASAKDFDIDCLNTRCELPIDISGNLLVLLIVLVFCFCFLLSNAYYLSSLLFFFLK